MQIGMTDTTAPAERPSWSTGRPTEDAWSPRVMTAPPDTETRVIGDLMLALKQLLNRCDMAEQAGSQCVSIATVRAIESRVSACELRPLVASEMARRRAAHAAAVQLNDRRSTS